jgi:hypothetical protein
MLHEGVELLNLENRFDYLVKALFGVVQRYLIQILIRWYSDTSLLNYLLVVTNCNIKLGSIVHIMSNSIIK